MFCVCPAEKKHKKSLSSTKRDERQTFRGTTHIRHETMPHFFRIQIYPIPVTEESRQRLLMRRVSAPQLKRELHRAGVCVRFQSSRTLPESRAWNDYFPLSSLCAIFVLIILPELSIVNVNFVTVLFHLCEQGVPCDEEKSLLKYTDQFRGACTAPQKRNPAFAYAGLREI